MTQEMKEKMDKEAFRLYPTFVQDREIYRKGFSDGIEITRQQVIDKACKHIHDHWDKLLVYDYNQYGGCVFNRQKTVEQFKQAMENE